MSTKIICDKCQVKSNEETWNGFVFAIKLESLKVKRFHICSECSSQMDTTIIKALKEFLGITEDISIWTMVPHQRMPK